ncbi:MAG: alpha/beta hydrolase [Candidatus Omnitrophica bacterium]|nr:alpha/beta hydrolase [Candidatus Omnitrophota bacterium]
MLSLKIQKGEFSGGFPFVRFGKGADQLVIFPPMHDALFPVTEFPWFFQLLFHEFSRDFTLTLISRRRKLPVGFTTQDMAEDYAHVLRRETGPSHILGVSLGGLISQHLAAEYPAYVRRLAVVAAAHKMGPLGLQIARRWIPWARAGRWKDIYEETMSLTYTRGHRGIRYRVMKSFLKKFLMPRIHDPADFIIAGQAGMLHDSSGVLPRIPVPVLIVGGTQDEFFPESLFREMASRIPEARCLVIPGAAHGVFEENRKQIVPAMLDFFRSPFPLKKKQFAGNS